MKNLKNLATTVLMSIIATVNAVAQTAYARFDETDATLTFYYDDNVKNSDYRMNEGTQEPRWLVERGDVHKVMFDPSFAAYRPTTTYAWFKDMHELETIQMLKNLNTEKVTTMAHMFDGCMKLGKGKFGLSLAGWNTENVTDMSYMFNRCKKVTGIDVSWFNTEKVTTMAYMFAECSGNLQELNLSNFKTANVTDMTGMFNGATYLRKVYVITANWQMGNVSQSTDMFRDAKSIAGSEGTAYSEQFTDNTYARVDGNNRLPGYFHDTPGYVVYDENCSLTFYCDGKRTEHEESGETVYDLNTGNNAPAWKDDVVVGVFFDESFTDCRPTTCHEWFKDMGDIDFIEGLDILNTSRVTSMCGMFSGCVALTEINTRNFVTDKVVDMSYMFNGCTNVEELDLRSFRTDAGRTFKGMFQDCASLTIIDLGNFTIQPAGTHGYYFSGYHFVNDENTNDIFAGCESLQTLCLPGTFCGIKASMIKGCRKLADIYYRGLSSFYVAGQKELTDEDYALLPKKKTRIHTGVGTAWGDEKLDYNFTMVKHNDMVFEIASGKDWDMLVAMTTEGKPLNVRLTNDITVTEAPTVFVGTFDGDGHTITVRDSEKEIETWSSWAEKQRARGKIAIGMPTIIGTAEKEAIKMNRLDGHSLFSELRNATVMNLHVDGEIHTGKYGAGLASKVNGTTTIKNCRVSTRIIFCGQPNMKDNNYADNGYVGGFVGNANNATLTIEGCTFDGEVLRDEVFEGKMKYVGTFVGWCSDCKNITVKNCMECGTYDNGNINHCGLNYDKSGSARAVKTVNTLHNKNWGEGMHGYVINSVDKRIKIEYPDNTATYDVSGITAYENGMTFDGKRYAGNGQTVSMDIFAYADHEARLYTVSWISVSSGSIGMTGGTWKLKMAANDCNIGEDFNYGAYLGPVGETTRAKAVSAFETDEETTAIQNTECRNQDTEADRCFTIDGRPISHKPHTGMYIMNGKKYMK